MPTEEPLQLFNGIKSISYNYFIEAWGMHTESKDTKLPNHKFMCINYDSHTRCILDYIHTVLIFLHTHRRTHTREHTHIQRKRRPQATYKNAHGEIECDAVFLCNLKYLWDVWPIFYLTHCNVLIHTKKGTNIRNVCEHFFVKHPDADWFIFILSPVVHTISCDIIHNCEHHCHRLECANVSFIFRLLLFQFYIIRSCGNWLLCSWQRQLSFLAV